MTKPPPPVYPSNSAPAAMRTRPTMSHSVARIPTAHIPPFGLRLQAVLKAELERAATDAGRSLNAEICDRLRQSFEPMVELEPDVLATVEKYAQDHDLSVSEALRLLLLAGTREPGAKIIHLQLAPGMTMAELTRQLQLVAQEEPMAEPHFASRQSGERRTIGAEIHSVESGATVRVVQRINMS